MRKIRVGKSRAQFIIANGGFAGCANYKVLGRGTDCNCTQFATRSWHYFTGEDLRVNYPAQLSNLLRSRNRNSSYLR